MTADFNQSSSDLPELPESLKRYGEGPLGDGFRLLFAELVKEFTVEQIAEIIGGSGTTDREVAELKAQLEAEGWKVLTSPTPKPNPLGLNIHELMVHTPTLESFLFPERPIELSEAEKLQASARPTRYSGLPDDLIILRPDAKTIDQRLKDLLGLRLNRGGQAGAKSSEDALGSDQLAAFEHLRTDEAAASALSKARDVEPHTPTPAEFRAEYATLLSRLEFLEGRSGRSTGQSTQKWLAEYDRMVAAQATAASETAQQAGGAAPVTSELWHAVRGVLGIPGLREALVNLAEKDGYRSDWYAEDLDNALEDLEAFEAEQEKVEPEATPTVSKFNPTKISIRLQSFLEDRVKPSVDAATEAAKLKGTQVHEALEKFYLDQSRANAPKSEEPRTGKDLSADFDLQDLIADYDESRLPGAAGYITLEGSRFPRLYAQLVELFTAEGFSDRDRLVGLLGLLDGYEASDDYSTGDAYHISRIRQLLKRR